MAYDQVGSQVYRDLFIPAASPTATHIRSTYGKVRSAPRATGHRNHSHQSQVKSWILILLPFSHYDPFPMDLDGLNRPMPIRISDYDPFLVLLTPGFLSEGVPFIH